MKTTNFLLASIIIFSFSIESASDVEKCVSKKVIGRAFVSKRGFAQEIKKVREMCKKAKPHWEKADVVWNLSDKSYDCMVGNFCK